MDKNGGSRLLQMQAKFQQKQMQERELKIASLYEAQQARALDRVRHSPSNIGAVSSPPSQQQQPTLTSHQHGKVRQMFEERRTKAGIDKSYPLQPIHNTGKPAPRKPLPNGYSKVTAGGKVNIDRKTSKTHTNVTSHSIKRQYNGTDNIVNGSGDLNHNHEPALVAVKQQLPQENNGINPISTDDLDRVDNNYLIENETFPEALAPTPTPRSPEPPAEVKKPPPRRTAAQRGSPAESNTRGTPIISPTKRNNTDNSIQQGTDKSRGGMQRGPQAIPNKKQPLSAKISNSASPVHAASPRARGAGGAGSATGAVVGSAGAGVPCTVCGRRFAPDRLDKHQSICKKSHTKKRKPFDALKHRLAGTEAEPFINKLRKPTTNTASTTKVKTLNNNWRQKHEEFIQAIRAAKQVQAHLNAGGKLSDLPPPPPSENPDYVACPHCGRRFNQAAAERHIPKCASYQFNKPKPAAKKR